MPNIKLKIPNIKPDSSSSNGLAALIFLLLFKLCILYFRLKHCFKTNNDSESTGQARPFNNENPSDGPNYVIVHPENFPTFK